MKRIMALLLTAVILVSGMITVNAETILMGDTDNNGVINAIDVRAILQIAARLKTAEPEEIKYYDMDNDNEITATDARVVLQTAAALIPPREYVEQNTSPEETASSVIRKEFINLVNEYRAGYGVPALKENDVLTAAASIRAEECLTKFSHTRPNGEPYSSVLKEEHKYEYISVAENIAWRSTGPHSSADIDKAFDERELKSLANAFFEMFTDDEPHKNNIIHPNMQEVGFGVAFEINKKDNTIKVTCSYLAAQSYSV